MYQRFVLQAPPLSFFLSPVQLRKYAGALSVQGPNGPRDSKYQKALEAKLIWFSEIVSLKSTERESLRDVLSTLHEFEFLLEEQFDGQCHTG